MLYPNTGGTVSKTTGGGRTVSLVILGHVPRKSNSRSIVKAGGKWRVIKSAQALRYIEDFQKQVPIKKQLHLGSKARPLRVEADIYYPWQTKGDLSGELVLDCLAKSGVIIDDRYVVEHSWHKRLDKEKPRVELTVTELDSWDWRGE
jgi:Holliday junction resolvase RusA-like endonuclease